MTEAKYGWWLDCRPKDLIAVSGTVVSTSDTTLTLYGLWHLVGETVAVSVLGLDCGDFTVATDGSVTVPYASDAGGLLTPAYLVANTNTETNVENNVTFDVTASGVTSSVTVPITVGLTYTTQGQVLRPSLAAELHSPFGPGLGKTRRGFMFAALVVDAVEISFGTDFDTTSTLTAAQFTTTDGHTARAEDSPFAGVYWNTLKDNYGFDTNLCWQVDRPYACTICSVSTFLQMAER